MNTNSSPTRAVALAALVVLSTVAGTAAFAAPAAATSHVTLVDGSADPQQVQPGTTVNNQKVYVVVDNVSADGNTDTYYVEFPNDLADGLSPNSANANNTSITSSVTLVDGYDNDGVDDTLKFSTSADGGGDIALNVSVDTSVDYPDKEDIHDIDFRVVDSSHGTATQSAVTSITAGSEPTVSDYAVTNPTDRDIDVSFNASEELTNVTVDVTDSTDSTVATLTEDDFSATNQSGTWVYTTTYTASADGDYTATLVEAEDEIGLDAAAGQSGTVQLNTVAVSVVDGTADPSNVSGGATVNNQQVTVTLAGVSADGDTDTHYVEFPNALADGLSVNAANANATSITSSAELVEGYDDDGTDDTVRFATSAEGGGTIPLNVSVDVSVDYPETNTTYGVDARVVDSDGDTANGTDVATITSTTNPMIHDYAVTNPDGRYIAVSFNASEELTNVTVDVTDDSGETVTTLSASDFSGSQMPCGCWVYTTRYTASADGEYTATLLRATDASGNDGASGQSGTVTLHTEDDDAYEGSPPPELRSFEVMADGQDVDVAVRLDARVDVLRVDVGGATDVELTREDFERRQRGDAYVYTADVATDTPGTFEAALVEAADVAGDAASGQTDSVTVASQAQVDADALAAPPLVDRSSSVHTFVVPVGADTVVAGETLSGVSVEYSEAFADAGGSVTSVSDDQNVVTLQVVSPDGSVTSRMGGTDAVAVNVVNGEVRLDLSDVDSSRIPSLEAGDRVLVRIEPVTNPESAGTYETDVTLETAAGSHTQADTTVHIRQPSSTAAVATTFVQPADDGVTLDVGGSAPVESVTVDSRADVSGNVRVTVPADRPAPVESAPGTVVTAMTIERPDPVADSTATISTTVATDDVDASADSLVVLRYDEDADAWARLDTDVASRSDGTVTLTATTQQTSLFAVTSMESAADQETATATPTPTTQTAADETTGTSTPGFGVAVALAALLGASLLVARRRE